MFFSFLRRLLAHTQGRIFYKRHAHEIEKFIFFVGYQRSVHSLVGQLLSAHPEILMTHEYNVLDILDYYSKPQQLFRRMCELYLSKELLGLIGKNYNYVVPGLFQNKVQRLTVIGDKRGGKTTELLYEDFSRLEKFHQFLDIPIRIFHVVRNPYDNISSYAKLLQIPLTEAIATFENKLYPTTMKVLEHYPDWVLTVHAEDLISDVKTALKQMLDFLDLSADEQYFEACRKIVWGKPRSSRWDPNLPWNLEQIQRVENEMIKRYSFLNRYHFDC